SCSPGVPGAVGAAGGHRHCALRKVWRSCWVGMVGTEGTGKWHRLRGVLGLRELGGLSGVAGTEGREGAEWNSGAEGIGKSGE
uniref:Uncharacterized protein n=1 Tax=Corvus moneduloides TaxID=1196302 RepID=A0A8C3D510_CORMO